MKIVNNEGIELAFLGIDAVLGAFLRYRITKVPTVLGGLSINILLVNVVGSLILGSFTIISPLLNLDANYTLFLSIGFCGSLTSMSSFALETCNLLDNRFFYFAALNIITNVFLSLGVLISGRALTNVILTIILH